MKLSPERQAQTWLVQKLAPLADYYVGDAFAAAHRDQPSLCGFCELLPSAMGRLFEREYCEISKLMESPERPSVFVLGGAKINDAFEMMGTVLGSKSADEVLAGGLVGEVLAWADGADIGTETRELLIREGFQKLIEPAKTLLAKFRSSIAIPSDYAWVKDGKRHEGALGELAGAPALADIGSKTASDFALKIRSAKTVFVNGPMGVFEEPLSDL